MHSPNHVTYPLACWRDLMSFFTFHVSTARFASASCCPPPPDDMAAGGWGLAACLSLCVRVGFGILGGSGNQCGAMHGHVMNGSSIIQPKGLLGEPEPSDSDAIGPLPACLEAVFDRFW